MYGQDDEETSPAPREVETRSIEGCDCCVVRDRLKPWGDAQPLVWAADLAERREGGMGEGRDGLPALFSPRFETVS